MISVATALWLSKPLRWAVAAIIGFGSYEVWKYHQQSIGAERAAAKIEKANTNAAKIGNAGASKSGVPGMRNGQRDPTTRDNGAN